MYFKSHDKCENNTTQIQGRGNPSFMMEHGFNLADGSHEEDGAEQRADGAERVRDRKPLRPTV